MGKEETTPQPPGRSGQPPAPLAKRVPALNALEMLAGLQLKNRYLWLVFFAAYYLLFQLTWVQFRHLRFDTLELASHLMAVIEAGLLGSAVVLALSLPSVRRAWEQRHPGAQFSYILHSLAAQLNLVFLGVLFLGPVLAVHGYPELVEKAGISVRLMLLQRAVLLMLAVLITYNVIQLLRYYLRIPLSYAVLGGIIWHIALGASVTYGSFVESSLSRLNDVFYYNQLWRYIAGFPKWETKEVFHNIGMPYFACFTGTAAIAWILLFLLSLPGAALYGSREKRVNELELRQS